MKAKTLTVITLLAVLALTLSGPATGLARQSASSPADSQNVELIGSIGGIAKAVVVQGNHAYVAAGENGLRVINVSNKSNPTEVAHYDTPGNACDVTVSGNYAYVADRSSGVRIIDVSNPSSPIEVGAYIRRGFARSVAVQGNYAYVAYEGEAYGENGLHIVDISNPTRPARVGFYTTRGDAYGVAVAGNYAYVLSISGPVKRMQIIDISNPSRPTLKRFLETVDGGAYTTSGVAVTGNYAYFANGYLYIFDVSNPNRFTWVGSYIPSGYELVYDVEVAGNYAYVATGGGLRIVSVLDPAHPAEVGYYNTSRGASGVAVSGNYTYLAANDSLLILRFAGATCSNDDFDCADELTEPPPNGWVNQVLETDTNSATVAPDDPDMGCGAGVNSHTIWYKLTPSYYGRVRLRTYSELPAGNSTYDTVLAVFTGQRGSLQRIACNDDAPGHGTLSELTFEAEAGQTYYIEVASYGNSPGGTLSLFYNYQVSPKAWTLMFYIAANNDLEGALKQQRDSLVTGSKNLNVNILALWDDNMNLFGSKYMVFAPWGVQEISKPELNTGDPQTLRDFVTWAMQEYPANHYALIISNHGQGFSGTSIDGFSHGDWLTVKETYQALLDIYPRLDIIYMNACLMATLDSAYQLADQADYYVASEAMGWGPTRYDYFITGMPEHRTEVSAIRSDTSPTELALSMAESYAYQLKFTSQGRNPSTISVIKLSEITDVAVAASDLAGLLKNRMGTVKTALNSIWEDVQRFDESWPRWEINTADRAADLYHFASLVSQRISDADIQGAAWNLRNKISAAVLFNEAWSGYPSGGGNAYWYHGDAHGISVFLPSGKKQCYYTGDWLDFAYGTDWGCQGATSIVGSSWITGTPFEWGPMLVEYFNQTNPSAPEELNPPEPVPLLTYHNVYLPLVLRSFGATPPPTPTPTPTPPPTPTPTPTPPPSGPSIRVEPTSGTFGTQFIIYGSGFTPGESVQQWVITPSGDRFDDPTPETVDSQGNYTSWVQIDSGPTGTYTLYARGNQSQQTVSAQFQITSSTGGLGTSRTINVLWK
jgi:hypothetical protein